MKSKNQIIAALDSFTRAYLVCALWSSTDDRGREMDSRFELSDFARNSLLSTVEMCTKFQTANAAAIAAAELDEASAGYCFWLNRNGHGSGFWDKYSKSDARYPALELLDKASHAAGETDLYAGDNGLLYFSR